MIKNTFSIQYGAWHDWIEDNFCTKNAVLCTSSIILVLVSEYKETAMFLEK